jgi:hypothetical protein
MHRIVASWTLGLCCALAAPVSAQSTAASAAAVAPALGASPHAVQHAAPDADREPDEGCAFRPLCFGPMVTLGAVTPLGFGAHLRYGRYLGFAVDYQFLPTRIDIATTSSTWSLITVEGRVYPFGGMLFFSGGFGYQRFAATGRQMTQVGPVYLSGSLGMPAIKLGFGLMGENGFVLGADIGFNILLGHSKVHFDKATGPGAAYQYGAIGLQAEIDEMAEDAMDKIPVVPQVNLIRMGYLF